MRTLSPPPSQTRQTVWNGLGLPVVPPPPEPARVARARAMPALDWFEHLQGWAERHQRGIVGGFCRTMLLGFWLVALAWLLP